jgi:hypothetical protein
MSQHRFVVLRRRDRLHRYNRRVFPEIPGQRKTHNRSLNRAETSPATSRYRFADAGDHALLSACDDVTVV